ncbi:Glycosyltransferase involved in cell wall bisynthesis [Halolactibacillus halophilus]|uniref:Glycosyl transferase n=1 Tax=Halolactibacillus halophilus TaxID=306540 RepID=A0A1I5QFG8_9BACI|nr:glycosyltransferase [Halolactibacillus halophilus]GEM02104.1 glycosyl transferase [Halolactibacillus halophilus]SFP44791.1 Glycosyltransferase involved in cell wall bisynthesis [Halolactibacillus halophilus]
MRVLIVARGYPSEKYNINGIFEFDQAKALASSGHEVILAAVDVRSLRRWRRWGYVNFVKDGVHVEALNIPCGRVPKFILNKFRKIALSKIYSRVVKKHGKPDVIHSHFIGIGYTTAKVFREKGIPLVHTEHYSGMNQVELSNYYHKLGSFTYENMTKIIVVSEYLKNNIMKKFGIEPAVVPNIVDLSKFNYEIKKKNKIKFNFISVGSLSKNKRMDLLINAFNDAFKDEVNVNLFIYGEGSERKNLEDLINKLNLRKRVILMGLKDRKIIAKKMQESHCFVLASKLETFGVVYIEAMSMGLPVIATKCGGPEDFINRENGVLVEVDNVYDLTTSLIFMKEHIKSFNRKRISDSVKIRYSPNVISEQLNVIYKEITSNR